jgi:V8-like Glu-specific endopeptidase
MNACGRGAQCAFAKSRVAAAIAFGLLVLTLGAGSSTSLAGAFAVAQSQARHAIPFWTSARMKSARPLDALLPGRPKVELARPGRVSAETPHRFPSLAPRTGASTSSAFEEVPDSAAVGARVNGVIFIVTPFGLGRCSGTSVNAPNYSVVFTAGHCIHSGGPYGWWLGGRWAFVPGYRYGQRPFGVFPAKWIDTTRQWRKTGSENFDVGAAVVSRNERGQLLAKAVGGTGIAWGLKAKQVFDVHGYPAEPPFDGETQHVCAQTPFLGHDTLSFLSPGPLNLAVDCDVTGGASGGGWTIAGEETLNSVTNYGYTDDPATDFGAYFGNEVGRLFARAGTVK